MNQHKPHRHRAVPRLEVTRAWTGCVRPGGCDGRSHGNVTYIDTCTCGATRRTESNQGFTRRGPWQDKEE